MKTKTKSKGKPFALSLEDSAKLLGFLGFTAEDEVTSELLLEKAERLSELARVDFSFCQNDSTEKRQKKANADNALLKDAEARGKEGVATW